MACENPDCPVVNFGCYGLSVTDTSKVPGDQVASVAEQLVSALTKDGFVYLKNHGIPQEMVRSLM